MIAIWNMIEKAIISFVAIMALALASWQMMTRYFEPSLSISWSEEIVIYLLVWGTLLAASGLVYREGHVRADLIVRMLSPPWQRAVETLNCVLGFSFAAAMAWLGFQVVLDAYNLGERSLSVLAFPLWIYYAALPVGMALVAIRYLIRLYQYVFEYDPGVMIIQSGHGS
jgi:C4-dicarboxylate transporter DctQ subunit